MAEYLGVRFAMSMRRIGQTTEMVIYDDAAHRRRWGRLELLVPRSRKGKFPTKLFARYARRCRSVDKVLLACSRLGLLHSQRRLAPFCKKVGLQLFHASHGIWTTRSVAITIVRSRINTRSNSFFDGLVLKSKGAVKVQKKILLRAFGITVRINRGVR